MKQAENKMVGTHEAKKQTKNYFFPATDTFEAATIDAENIDEALKKLELIRK